MTKHNKVATVFGGTGFLGRQVVRELAREGWIVQVATRVPERAYFLKPCGAVGQIVPIVCDYYDSASIYEIVKRSDYVINCIGILFERGKRRSFQNIHVHLPSMIAKACADSGVERFVHVSALGVDKSLSSYGKSKKEGEAVVLQSFPEATIVRPGIIFGTDDDFFNKFARMAQISPVLPLIGGGKTKFQPVYVGDVADAIKQALIMCPVGGDSPLGKTYELGGPDCLSFKDIFEILLGEIQKQRLLVSLSFPIAKVLGAVLSFMPTPLLTVDQVRSLQTDNVVSSDANTLKDLKINPAALSVVLPQYLHRYKDGGRFARTQFA